MALAAAEQVAADVPAIRYKSSLVPRCGLFTSIQQPLSNVCFMSCEEVNHYCKCSEAICTLVIVRYALVQRYLVKSDV